jgi:hypothetical protein
VTGVIHDILIIHRETETPLYHWVPGGKSKLASIGLDSALFAKLSATIVRALRRAGALDRLVLREAKIAFLVYENLIFALITSHDHDEFEINDALDRFSSLFLKSYSTDVISGYKDKPLSFNAFDVSGIFRSDRVVVTDMDTIMKSMIQRLADMIALATRLEQDGAIIAEKKNIDGTVVLSIGVMQQELEKKLEGLKTKMKQLPLPPGLDFGR